MKLYDTIPHYLLKYLRRKVYPEFFSSHSLPLPECEKDLEKSNKIIYNCLAQDGPCMIARLGATEMGVVGNYIGIKEQKHSIIKYIQGEGS